MAKTIVTQVVKRMGLKPFVQKTRITNSRERITVVDERSDREVSNYLYFEPAKAIEFAIALLNAAANVQDHIHGEDEEAQYTSKKIAQEVLSGERKAE